ncbi:hypothetical protein GCM10010954_14480 [Halobacillus andaensis]|uniref:Uncharacterized protein n=1 Tax=Halobacillus andaensis TaxID=1176239 RepID=A0A917B3Y4_HALAA|nr:hypothetical protein [Halobacillus andaensis]MBP2004252.1 hypothetical protein [Halobacillus andaensis]GGF16936.1 hypothetical protein GCM10010954_14480 [Halobacillus andaensis]
MKQLIIDLHYIKSTVETGNYKNKIPILLLLVSEGYELIKEKEFVYKYRYINENNKHHFDAIANKAKQGKAKLLTDLKDLEIELSQKNIKVNRVMAIIKRILATGLYRNEVQRMINIWTPKICVDREYKQTITVK